MKYGSSTVRVNALLPPQPHAATSPIPPSAVTATTQTTWSGLAGVIPRPKLVPLRLFVTATMTTQTRPRHVAGLAVPGWRTLEHEETWRKVSVAFIGILAPENAPTPTGVGQFYRELAQTRPDAYGRGLALADLAALRELWSRWHDNDMHLQCPHQPAPLAPTDEDDERPGVPQCVSSGYVYGSDRLIEVMDPHVRTRIRQVGAALTATGLTWEP